MPKWGFKKNGRSTRYDTNGKRKERALQCVGHHAHGAVQSQLGHALLVKQHVTASELHITAA